MGSRSRVCARPVRPLPRPPLNACTLWSIFWSVVFFRSAITIAMAVPRRKSYVNERALVLAEDHAPQGVLLEDAEHRDRQLLVPAQGERGRVHDLQIAHDRLVEGELRVPLRARVSLRVYGVDAV